MSTMFSSSSGLNKNEITVTSTNQILSGYKDYDNNGNLLTGSNAGYDAGVTQGEANMKDGVTLDYDGNHLIQGYKARTSAGVLITGTNKGYDAGVTQGHADRDSGVTVTAASQIISGYKARNSSGTLLTGTDAGYNAGYTAGRAQGQADRDSGVTVTAANQILSGYKARNSSGTLLTGTAQTGKQVSVAYTLGQDLKVNRIVSFSATNGAVYAIALGGYDDVPTSMPTYSGCTLLDYHYQMVDGRGNKCALAIVQATSTTISVTVFSSTKQVACVVTRVTN